MNKKLLSFLICMLVLIPVISANGTIEKNIKFIKNTNSILLSVDENNPPNPPIVEGPLSGNFGETYVYHITLIDPDEGDIMFNLEINFGDEVIQKGCGCGKSWQNGTVLEVLHRWKIAGEYRITARVQDSYGEWSEWSEPLIVSMPRNKAKVKLFVCLFNDFMDNFLFSEKLFSLLEGRLKINGKMEVYKNERK